MRCGPPGRDLGASSLTDPGPAAPQGGPPTGPHDEQREAKRGESDLPFSAYVTEEITGNQRLSDQSRVRNMEARLAQRTEAAKQMSM